MAALLQLVQELVRAGERLDLVDHRVEQVFPVGPQPVAEPLLDLVAGYGGDELVPAHADVSMEPPHGEDYPVRAEGAIPAERMVIVRVDECAVDVEDAGGHAAGVPA
jgi:hypothetical protein